MLFSFPCFKLASIFKKNPVEIAKQLEKEIASLKHALYDFGEESLKHIEIIPLFEQVTTIIKSNHLLEKYLNTPLISLII